MKNEEIAIELVKAWSMQPSTAQKCFVFDEIFENYKKALAQLREINEDNKNVIAEIRRPCKRCEGRGFIHGLGPGFPGIASIPCEVCEVCEVCDGKGYTSEQTVTVMRGKDE